MLREEIIEEIREAKATLGAEYRAELCAARAVVLRRHYTQRHGWIAELQRVTGLDYATVLRAFEGVASDATYDALAEVVGLDMGALDREAEALVALHAQRLARREKRNIRP